jgi:predicted acyltransferase
MKTEIKTLESQAPGRVVSVDFFRGLTMFLLAGEASRLYEHFQEADSAILNFLGTQLSHHAWHGLRFWDLIQPFFMFIVGVAIPFTMANRLKKGESVKKITLHAFKRSGFLLFFGWALYFVAAGQLVFRFQNVLAQLSVTYLVAFLIMRKSVKFQIVFSLALLLFIDLAYRFFPVDGYNQPWEMWKNLGEWINLQIEGVGHRTNWATLNVISTTAHTIWGVLCGKLLMSDRPVRKKLSALCVAGVSSLAVGYALDLLNITPIIKRIATASFVFVSGGWTILALAFSYWLIDVRKLFKKGATFFTVVGMNSIFIYLFFESGGADFLTRIAKPFGALFFSWGGEMTVAVTTSLMVWAAMWYMCYWLFGKKVFIRI